MSNIWYAIPSAKPAAECNAALAAWRLRGYKTCVFRDHGQAPGVVADQIFQGEYHGWYKCVNFLHRMLWQMHPEIEWIVTGGDDMTPDPVLPPELIARQCTDHFKGTYGVMQPVGDPWGQDVNGLVAAERICGSPWVGKEFALRYRDGNGVFPEEYHHFFGDAQLREELIGTPYLWQRKDLTHFHMHWQRLGQNPPAYMQKMGLKSTWARDEAIFKAWEAEWAKLPA